MLDDARQTSMSSLSIVEWGLAGFVVSGVCGLVFGLFIGSEKDSTVGMRINFQSASKAPKHC